MPNADFRMSRAEALDFLREQRKGHVACIYANGLPHLSTVYHYVLDNERIAFWAYTKSQKIVNLRRNPAVALLAEFGAEYSSLRGVCVSGTGTIIDDTEQVSRLAFEMSESRGLLDAARIARVREQAPKRSVVVIDPIEIASWNHGSSRS